MNTDRSHESSESPEESKNTISTVGTASIQNYTDEQLQMKFIAKVKIPVHVRPSIRDLMSIAANEPEEAESRQNTTNPTILSAQLKETKVERDTLKKQLLIEWDRQLTMDEEMKQKYQKQLQLEGSMKEVLERTKNENRSLEERLRKLEVAKLDAELKSKEREKKMNADFEEKLKACRTEWQGKMDRQAKLHDQQIAKLHKEHQAKLKEAYSSTHARAKPVDNHAKAERLERMLNETKEAFQAEKNLLLEKLKIVKSELAEERQRSDAAVKKMDRECKKKIKDLQKQFEEKEMGLLAREVAANKEWTQEVEALEAALAKAQQEKSDLPKRIVKKQAESESKLKALQAKTAADSDKVDSAEDQVLDVSDARLDKLRAEHQQLIQRYEDALARQKTDYESQISELRAEQSALEEKLKSQKSDFDAEVGQVEQEREARVTDLERMLKEEQENNNKERQALLKKCQELEDKAHAAEVDLARVKHQMEMNNKVETFENRIKDLEVQIAAAQEETHRVIREEYENKLRIKQLQFAAQIRDLNRRIVSLQDKEQRPAAAVSVASPSAKDETVAELKAKLKQKEASEAALEQQVLQVEAARSSLIADLKRKQQSLTEVLDKERAAHDAQLKNLQAQAPEVGMAARIESVLSRKIIGLEEKLALQHQLLAEKDSTEHLASAKAIKDFHGGIRDDEELLVLVGESVTVSKKSGGWWYGSKTQKGWFPAAYVSVGPSQAASGSSTSLPSKKHTRVPSFDASGVGFVPFDKWIL